LDNSIDRQVGEKVTTYNLAEANFKLLHVALSRMRTSLFTVAAFLLRLAHAESIIFHQLQPVEIFYQPLTQSTSTGKVSQLASISYNVSTLDSIVHQYTPPAAAETTNEPQTSSPLIRIFTNSAKGSTSVTSLSTFKPTNTPILTLHLNDDASVFAASFSADPLSPSSSSKDPSSNLIVNILPPTPGPAPKLNQRKPVVVGADGKEVPQVPEVEKSFFQKYWWAFALVAVLALTGGGGDK
jgi:hypothetical protein